MSRNYSVNFDCLKIINFILGIACLTIALFISARMGIYQETLYKKHGKHPQEALFYTVSIELR